MKEEEKEKDQMISFTPQNYSIWMEQLQGLATQCGVWQYIDPDGIQEEPEEWPMPEVSGYLVQVTANEENIATPAPTASSSSRSSTTLHPTTAITSTPTLTPMSSTRPARHRSELSPAQRKDFMMTINVYLMMEDCVDKVRARMNIVRNAVRQSVRPYITPDQMNSSVRSVVELLVTTYGELAEELGW